MSERPRSSPSCLSIRNSSAFAIALFAVILAAAILRRQSLDTSALSQPIISSVHLVQSVEPSTLSQISRGMAASAATKATGQTMRAIVAQQIGGPEVLKFRTDWPKPVASSGQVLIRIKAFGLNRAEMFTRQGHSPGVEFPRVLGIEASGVVESAPGSEAKFPVGSTVVTCMGDMGRSYDGGYAEYTLVKAAQVKRVDVQGDAPWEILGALPEMMQTAYGSLFTALQLKKGDRLLIRGGTTTIGLAAANLAKRAGAYIVSTTRNESRASMLREHGADDVIIDPTGKSIADEVARRWPDDGRDPSGRSGAGFDKILELVGTVSLADSMKCLRRGGITCMTGIAGGSWAMPDFQPITTIPKGTYLTAYGGGFEDLMDVPLDEILQAFKDGEMKLPIKTFQMEEIVEAHKFLEHTGGAKVVVLVP